jgi:ABC-type antimicrobial peptide transport system permease subunit
VIPLADLLPEGVDPWDPRMFAGAAAALIATGVAAAAVPARRAARVDPAVALRHE